MGLFFLKGIFGGFPRDFGVLCRRQASAGLRCWAAYQMVTPTAMMSRGMAPIFTQFQPK